MQEANAIAVVLLVAGLLILVSVLGSRAAIRFNVPVALLFIGMGMLAGSDGIGGIQYHDYGFAFRAGTFALALILFDGGLNTSIASFKRVMWPSVVLATVGVVIMAGVTGLAAWGLGFELPQALLLGAIVSSTDAAAVFSMLRGSGLSLKKRVAATIELESGLNDPMAVVLTLALTAYVIGEQAGPVQVAVDATIQLATGAVCGVGMGYAGRWLLQRVRLHAGGLYPVLTLALALVTFGGTTLLNGSGFLAVFVAGMLIGNDAIRYRTGVLRVHDALAWMMQVTMFLLLGLLTFPSQLADIWVTGLLLGLAVVVGRFIPVFLCLLPFRSYTNKERVYISWVGLRGSVPIILSIFPVLAGATGAQQMFNIVCFIVVTNAIVTGMSLRWVTRKMGLLSDAPPPPPAALEITSAQILNGEIQAFYIDEASAVNGASLADLPLPAKATVAMVVRGDEILAPRGDTVLCKGDHVYIVSRSEDAPLLRLFFGRSEAEE